MGKDLRDFLKLAREAGPDYYTEVKKPLKPKYEVCVISQKLARENRFPVLYCPRIEGSKLTLVNGVFGSYELLGLALGITPEKLKEVGKNGIFQEFVKRRSCRKPTREVASSQAPVQEIVLTGKDIDLGLLPIVHHYELNPTKYITIGMTICKDPDTGIPNVGVYREEIISSNEMKCEPDPVHHGDQIAKRWAEHGQPMEVVTFIGHHPLVAMGATGPHSIRDNEFEIMGGLLNEPLEVVRGVSVDLPVPAFAEIAIEGVVDPTRLVHDGPFSETYGYYGDERPTYAIKVTAITMRKDAIYNNLDPLHAEHNMVSQLPREARLYERIKSVVPTVKAVHYGPQGLCGQNLIYLSLKKRNPEDGRLAALTALTTDRARKIAVAVDEDIDVYNEQEVLWAIGNRVRGELDIDIIPRIPIFHLNPTARDETGRAKGNMDTRILIDATEPEGFATRVTPPQGLWETMKLEDYLK